MTSPYLKDLYAHRHTFRYLVRLQLILRYQRTVLGFAWTLLNPLVTMTIAAIVFSMILRIELRSYAVFLLSGTIPWLFFSTALLQSVGAFVNNEGLIKKVYIPKLIFPGSVAASALIDSLLAAVALLLILVVIGGKIGAQLLVLPFAFLLLFPFVLAMGLIASVATVYFRDLQYIVNHILQLVYFLTPVLYPLDMIPPKFHALYALNPMVHYIELFRAPIYRGVMPGGEVLLITAMIGFGSLLVALAVFRRFENQLVFRL